MTMHKWRQVADTLAAAMQHSEGGVCTLTGNEHAALAVYVDARRPGRMFTRTMLGLTGGLDAFNHVDHHPGPSFEVVSEEDNQRAGTRRGRIVNDTDYFGSRVCGVAVCNWSGPADEFDTHPHRAF